VYIGTDILIPSYAEHNVDPTLKDVTTELSERTSDAVLSATNPNPSGALMKFNPKNRKKYLIVGGARA
jgi:hypothetical protein